MQIDDLVMFEEEIQIKRCFWETVDRFATVREITPEGVVLDVHCIPPRRITLQASELQVVPTAEVCP